MDPRDVVMLAIQEEPDEFVYGRTLLQKKVHFASCLTGQELGFRPHYYGPYSQAIADAANSLVSNGFVEEKIETFPGEANLFGEWRRHSYSLTEDGKSVVEAMPETDESEAWREALRKVNSHPIAQDFNLLSVAAKMYVILKELRRARTTAISRQAQRYGWELPAEDIEKVGDYLVHLGLVERAARHQ